MSTLGLQPLDNNLHAQAAAARPRNLTPGMRIGPNRLIRFLGEGAIAKVWAAIDQSQNRIALKIYNLTDESHERLPQLEVGVFEYLKKFSSWHPNIVKYHGYGRTDNGELYLAMEQLEGRTLHDIISEGSLPIAEALRILKQVALAVNYLHEKGLMHGDLKTENIMICRDGSVKLIDLGFAGEFKKFTGGGTALYQAPEQLEKTQAMPRSEIFTLGAIFYMMIRREHPYHSGRPEIQTVSVYDAEVRGRMGKEELSPGIENMPAYVRIFLKRMLDIEPGWRYRSMEEVTAAIDEVAKKLPAENQTIIQFKSILK